MQENFRNFRKKPWGSYAGRLGSYAERLGSYAETNIAVYRGSALPKNGKDADSRASTVHLHGSQCFGPTQSEEKNEDIRNFKI